MISFKSKKLLDRIQLIESYITKGDKSHPAIEPLNEEYHSLAVAAAYPEYVNSETIISESRIHNLNKNLLTESEFNNDDIVISYMTNGKEHFYLNENKTVSEFKNLDIIYDKLHTISI